MSQVPLAPPPQTGQPIDGWLYLLWKRLTATGTVALQDSNSVAITGGAISGTTLTMIGYTVATLPVAGTAGRIAYVTDALAPAFLVAVVGGGAVKSPVFDDGAAWVAF
jgi:hypothetical protein